MQATEILTTCWWYANHNRFESSPSSAHSSRKAGLLVVEAAVFEERYTSSVAMIFHIHNYDSRSGTIECMCI